MVRLFALMRQGGDQAQDQESGCGPREKRVGSLAEDSYCLQIKRGLN